MTPLQAQEAALSGLLEKVEALRHDLALSVAQEAAEAARRQALAQVEHRPRLMAPAEAAVYLKWASEARLKDFESSEWASAYMHRPDKKLLLIDVHGLEAALIWGAEAAPLAAAPPTRPRLMTLKDAAAFLKWANVARLRRWRFNKGGLYSWCARYFKAPAKDLLLVDGWGLESGIIAGECA